MSQACAAQASSTSDAAPASLSSENNQIHQQPQQPQPQQKKTKAMSFYQRPLPESCTAFESPQGKSYFRSALEHNGLFSFYSLIQQHSTQTEPAYCGLASLVIALNALRVDPRQAWKQGYPWRWYEESMLNCCLNLDQVKETGITLTQFICLAKCQGLDAELYHVKQQNEKSDDADENNINISDSATGSDLEQFRQAVRRACMDQEQTSSSSNTDVQQQQQQQLLVILIVSYARRVLGQTGTGHFSPIAAYDPASDQVLILDTARFKYGTHWVPLTLLYRAMQPMDPDTGRPRGYALLSAPQYSQSVDDDEADAMEVSPIQTTNGVAAVTTTTCRRCAAQLEPAVLLRSPQNQKVTRRLFKERFLPKSVDCQKSCLQKSCLCNDGPDDDQGDLVPSLQDVALFCTKNGTDLSFVWQMTQVQLKPIDTNVDQGDGVTTLALVDQMRHVLDRLLVQHAKTVHDDRLHPLFNMNMTNSNATSSDLSIINDTATDSCVLKCRPNYCRTFFLSVPQVIFLFYLACLPQAQRRDIVNGLSEKDHDDENNLEGGQQINQVTNSSLRQKDESNEKNSVSSLLVDSMARQQLLVEARLLRLAIIVSNSDEL